MKRYLWECAESKKPIDPFLTITVDSSSEPATSTSTIIASTADPMPSVLASAATVSLRAILAPRVTTAQELRVSPPVSALAIAPVAHLDAKLPDSRTIMQANVRSTESEQNLSTGLGFFSNAQNVLITGGTFVNVENYNYNVNSLPANTDEGPMKIPVPQKPNSSPFFTGRKDVLEKLGEIFVHHSKSTLVLRRSCLLWGMGGIGKTQICLKFIEEMSCSFAHVFWVDASSQDSITMSLKGISGIPAAQAFGMDGSVNSVLQWISCIQEEWLIVFDNADDPPPEVVAKFIPLGNRGNILITSRNRSMGRVISFSNSIEINEMEESDAVTLLLKASCLDHSAEHLQPAKEIVIELGCIPLAVDHAGAYIEAGKCNINRYLRQLSLHRQTLMSDAAFTGASSYNQTVYGTWDLSFKEIERRARGQSTIGNEQAAQAAILILQICAFYHHNNISRDIFRSAAEESRKHAADSEGAGKLPQAITSLDHTLLSLLSLDSDGRWDEFIIGQGISVLLSFSLMKRGQSSEMLSIHPLMHCWSQERMSKPEQQRMCWMGRIILCCAVTHGDTSQDYALRRLLFPHIKACELHGVQMGFIKEYFDDMYNNFAQVMQENGNWNNAEQLYFEVMNMRKKLLGAEHPDTLESMGNLAGTYRDQGRWNEAEQLEIQVMDMTTKLFGAEHPSTLLSMANLARTYYNQGRWNETEQLEIQVMYLRKKLLGAEHPDTLLSMGNLADTYCKQGRWNEAEQLAIQVMDMTTKLFGAEHPSTLNSMGDLANAIYFQGRWNEAEQLEVQVLDMRKKLLGTEHPDTLESMGNLAMTYCDQGRWNEGEQLQIQVMDVTKNLLGAEHPFTLISMGNLANTYYNQGRLNEAEEIEIQLIDTRKKLFGVEHPHTLLSMGLLANTYRNQGRWNEAEQLQIQVMDIRKKLHGIEHPDTLKSMGDLAITYCDQERLNEAEQLAIQVMDMRMKLFGIEHPDTLKSMENLASTYHKLGRWNEAEQLELQVMNIRQMAGKD